MTMTPTEQNQFNALQSALAPFAAIAAETDYSKYPPETIIRCEATAGELQAALDALTQTAINRTVAAASVMLKLLRDPQTESISWLDRRDAILDFIDGTISDE